MNAKHFVKKDPVFSWKSDQEIIQSTVACEKSRVISASLKHKPKTTQMNFRETLQ
jgi:hypothetical protein